MSGKETQIFDRLGVLRRDNPKRTHGDISDDIDMRDVSNPPDPKKGREDFDLKGVSPELVELLNKQLEQLDLSVIATLSSYKPGGAASAAWASEWKMERLHLALPVVGLSVDNSLFDQVILSGIKNVRTRVTLTQGLGAEDHPQLSTEDERFMGGILSAMSGDPPSTLKTGSSSILDLTFFACWNLAAARLVSDKSKRQNIHPSVLPDKPVKGSSASEYLGVRFRALKATLGTQFSYLSDTVERVLKLWSEANSDKMIPLLLRTKISWSLVLSKGGEFKTKTVGKNRTSVRNLSTPLNPKDAAWVMPYERKILSHLCALTWGRVDAIGKEWAAISAIDSHSSFDSFVDKVKLAYREMHRISESVVRRLGVRKSIVLNSPHVRALSKKSLREKKPNDLVLIFSKSDLTLLPDGAKAIYDPFWVGEAFVKFEELNHLFGGRSVIAAIKEDYFGLKNACTEASNKLLLDWEKNWLEAFQPPRVYGSKDRPTTALETQNMFTVLDESQE